MYSEMHFSLIRDSQKGTETRFSVTETGVKKTVGEVYCQGLHAYYLPLVVSWSVAIRMPATWTWTVRNG